jgi:hypothetical protein
MSDVSEVTLDIRLPADLMTSYVRCTSKFSRRVKDVKNL